MTKIYEILAPLAPFLADEHITTICLTSTGKLFGDDDDGEDFRRRVGGPKPPQPVPSPATA